MAELMAEWRRAASPCRGALVLWWKDMLPGAGLGVLDDQGLPKVAYHYLRRALAPVAVWMVDEGVNGVGVHVANERPEPLQARLRVALYRDGETQIAQASEEIVLAPRSVCERSVEGLIGRFVDAAWAYRFGPAAGDATFASLESAAGPATLLSQSVMFPAGRPISRESADRLGVAASASTQADGIVRLTVRSQRLLYGVRPQAPGFTPSDDAFSIEPGGERELLLIPSTGSSTFSGASISAINLAGSVRAEVQPE
jgi:beta-mannosidase